MLGAFKVLTVQVAKSQLFLCSAWVAGTSDANKELEVHEATQRWFWRKGYHGFPTPPTIVVFLLTAVSIWSGSLRSKDLLCGTV